MDRVAYWVGLAAVLWYAWPALEARRMRVGGVALAVLLPVFSWIWLVVVGRRRRVELRDAAAREQREVDEIRTQEQHRRDVRFWRDRARSGTPAEREAARGYLETLGLTVEPTESEEWAGSLAEMSVQELADMCRCYAAIVRSVVARPEIVRSSSRKLGAVQSELLRRGAGQYR